MLNLFVALLGLFPAIFIYALQAMLLLMLGWMLLYISHLKAAHVRRHVTWTHVALWQFFAFFLMNAIVFAPLPGTPDHYRATAIETWSLSLLISVLLIAFLSLQKPELLKRALLKGLPIGLAVTFIIATAIYMDGIQGGRIQILTPNPLVPPLWFLILTMMSFAWIREMSFLQQLFRGFLFFCAGVMTIYTGARLVLVVWLISGAVLAGYYSTYIPGLRRRQLILFTALGVGAACFLMWWIDLMLGGVMWLRFTYITKGGLSYAALSERASRLILWSSALEVIKQNWILGSGLINERVLIQQEIGWESWLRTHQTYLSYLIAGGLPALISGVCLQLPVLQFLRRSVVQDMFPVFVGLGLVLTLNCLTDSVFQSGTAVQAYMVILLLFCRAQSAGRLRV